MTELCLHTFINQERFLISFPKLNWQEIQLDNSVHRICRTALCTEYIDNDEIGDARRFNAFLGNNLVPKVNHHPLTRWKHVRNHDHFTSGSSLYCWSMFCPMRGIRVRLSSIKHVLVDYFSEYTILRRVREKITYDSAFEILTSYFQK